MAAYQVAPFLDGERKHGSKYGWKQGTHYEDVMWYSSWLHVTLFILLVEANDRSHYDVIMVETKGSNTNI